MLFEPAVWPCSGPILPLAGSVTESLVGGTRKPSVPTLPPWPKQLASNHTEAHLRLLFTHGHTCMHKHAKIACQQINSTFAAQGLKVYKVFRLSYSPLHYVFTTIPCGALPYRICYGALTATPQPGWPDLLSYSMSCRTCQKGFCIGVSWKDKACSPLSSVAFSKHQPASLSLTPLCTPLAPCVSFPVLCFCVPMSYQTNIKKSHAINILLVCVPSDTYTHKSHTHTPEARTWESGWERPWWGDHMSRRCISVGSPSALCQTTIT